jgi:hypothetical protein
METALSINTAPLSIAINPNDRLPHIAVTNAVAENSQKESVSSADRK